jgi:hypothetical protein
MYTAYVFVLGLRLVSSALWLDRRSPSSDATGIESSNAAALMSIDLLRQHVAVFSKQPVQACNARNIDPVWLLIGSLSEEVRGRRTRGQSKRANTRG